MTAQHFAIGPAFWSLFPAARIGVIVARGMDNTRNADTCALLLEEATLNAARRLAGMDIATHAVIAPWREAYRAFGVKPAKQRSSIENLLRSAVAAKTR